MAVADEGSTAKTTYDEGSTFQDWQIEQSNHPRVAVWISLLAPADLRANTSVSVILAALTIFE